jgi:hypothetical protein
MRLLRERRRSGAHLVTIELYRTGVDQLVAQGWLDRRERNNRLAVREAFVDFSLQAFGRHL